MGQINASIIQLGQSGDASKNFVISVPAVPDGTLSIARQSGTQVLSIDAIGQVTGNIIGGLHLGTAIALTTLTDKTKCDFTVPSWVKRITVTFNSISTAGTSIPQIQLGSGSFLTSGYSGASSGLAGSVASASYASGALLISSMSSTILLSGAIRITNIEGNNWIFDGVLGRGDSAATSLTGGVVGLSGVLDRIRLTTVNGTDLFDAGTINIIYEG